MASDRLSRETAARALRAAAESRQVAVVDLRVAEYRAFRRDVWDHERHPSELAITLLFGGWSRACAHVAQPPVPADVEDEVRDRLYRSPGRPR